MKIRDFWGGCVGTLLGLAMIFGVFGAVQPVFAANELLTFKGHSQAVHSVAFSSDGEYALSGGQDKSVILWEVETGNLIHTFTGHEKAVRSVAISPDGQQVLSGSSDRTLKLWDVTTGKIIRTFKGHEDAVSSVAFSPDGKYALSGSQDKAVILWKLADGNSVRSFTGHKKAVLSVAFSPDGQFAVSGSEDKTVKLWEVDSGKNIHTFKREVHSFSAVAGHTKPVNSVAFSPDGQFILSGSNDKSVKLWNVEKSRLVRTYRDSKGAVTSVTFSPDGQHFLSGGTGKTLKLWQVKSKKPTREFKGHTDTITAVAFSQDGQFILSSGKDHTVKLWALDPSRKNQPPRVAQKKPDQVQRPIIRITSHEISRGISVVPMVPETLVAGKVEDASGISEVTINGKKAMLDANGDFSIFLPLKPGRNEILIVAKNVNDKMSQKRFWLEATREGGADSGPLKTTAVFSGDSVKYHALIIGNNNYEYLPQLQTAINDAKEIDRLLREQYGFTTTVLLDAGRSQIMNGFNEVREQLGPDDSLLIYYAGHGEFDKSVGKAYWLPTNAKPDNDTNWIIVDNITSNIKRMSSRHILVVADSCYSGTLTRSAITKLNTADEKTRYLEKMRKRASRTLMASGGNEPVADSDGEEGSHSVFAQAFIDALRDPGFQTFTAEQLFYSSIKESVAGNAEQVPEYNIIKNSGHKGGDFVFVRK